MRSVLILGVSAGALTLGACGTNAAHNDVLLFGTTTVIGVDVQPRPEQQTVNVTLGYRRQEAVWMPLLANGQDSALVHSDVAPGETAEQVMYQGEVTVRDAAQNVIEQRTDSYSVFASLGATIEGEARRGGTDTSGSAAAGIAQFFATGAAAQALAESDSVNLALAVQPGLTAAAQARAEIAQAQLQATQAELAAERQRGAAQATVANTGNSWLGTATMDSMGELARAGGACRVSDAFSASILSASDATSRRQSISLKVNSRAASDAADQAAINNFVNRAC